MCYIYELIDPTNNKIIDTCCASDIDNAIYYFTDEYVQYIDILRLFKVRRRRSIPSAFPLCFCGCDCNYKIGLNIYKEISNNDIIY